MTGEVEQDWELLQNDWKTPEEEKAIEISNLQTAHVHE